MKHKILTLTGAALMSASPLAAQTLPIQKPEVIRVGSYEVYILQESAHAGSTNILIDAPAQVLARYAPRGTFPMATNAVLIRRRVGQGDYVWLVDTGYGRTIFDQMAALGIQPGDVQQVLMTHLHSDHTGGMLREGVRAFPNATVSLSQRELDYWNGQRDGELQRIFSEYGDAVRTFTPTEIDTPMQDGITPVAAYGHTPGHTMYLIREGDQGLLIWGDLTHAMAVQMPHPEISVTYDTDPDAARESRLKVLRYIAGSDTRIVGMHVPGMTAGGVCVNGDGGDGETGYTFFTR